MAETLLGNASEARDALGIDMAELWEKVAKGELIARRPDSDTGPWMIYRV